MPEEPKDGYLIIIRDVRHGDFVGLLPPLFWQPTARLSTWSPETKRSSSRSPTTSPISLRRLGRIKSNDQPLISLMKGKSRRSWTPCRRINGSFGSSLSAWEPVLTNSRTETRICILRISRSNFLSWNRQLCSREHTS